MILVYGFAIVGIVPWKRFMWILHAWALWKHGFHEIWRLSWKLVYIWLDVWKRIIYDGIFHFQSMDQLDMSFFCQTESFVAWLHGHLHVSGDDSCGPVSAFRPSLQHSSDLWQQKWRGKLNSTVIHLKCIQLLAILVACSCYASTVASSLITKLTDELAPHTSGWNTVPLLRSSLLAGRPCFLSLQPRTENFESFSDAMLSLFQCFTLDSSGEIYRPLISHNPALLLGRKQQGTGHIFGMKEK